MAESFPLSEELTCSVCLELFETPIQLPCLHSFCEQCLIGILDKNVEGDEKLEADISPFPETHCNSGQILHCPDCRKVVVLGPQRVSELPRNFTLHNIVSKYKVTIVEMQERLPVPCSLCEDKPKAAIKTCLDCPGLSYCKECLCVFHPLRGVLKTHRLVDPVISSTEVTQEASEDILETENKSSSLQKPLQTDQSGQHGTLLVSGSKWMWKTLYCFTCVECFMTTVESSPAHVGHNIKELDDAVAEKKKISFGSVQLLREARETQANKLEEIRDKVEQTEEESAEVNAKIEDILCRLKEAMELKKTEIQKLLEQSLESFGKSQDQVCMTIDEIDSLINQFEGDTTGLDLDGKLLYLQNQGTWSSTCDRILTPKDIILEDTIISSTMQDLDVLVTELETFIASVLMQKGAPTLENVKCTSFKENIKVQVRWTPCDRAQTYNIRLLSTLPDGRPEERVIRHLTDKESTGYDISFLRPDTTYHVAVASVYSGCESKYCEAVTLTTTLTEKDQLTSPPQISDLYEIISNTDTATIGLLLAGCTEGETYCIRLTAADNESVKYDFSYKIIFDKRPEWSISGLKYSTTYNVSVAAVSLHVGYSLSAPVSITTGKQVLCPEFHLDPEDHHPGVMLDFPHASVADKECSRNLIDASVPNIWSNVRGVAANINLVDDANQYWEVRVKYDIISTLDDYDILADIGICETTKRDLFSPTSQNDHSLCCSIIKQGRVPYVVLKYWDGTKRRTSTECSVLFPLSRRVTTVFKLGFYLDFDHRVMKLVHVDNNRLLHVFTDLSIQDVLPMCELYNAEKVAITLKFITGSEVKTIPSVIRESAPT